jgi:hypothetical protein
MPKETVSVRKSAAPPPAARQRAAERIPCDLRLNSRLLRRRLACAALQVVDISLTGLALLLDRPLGRGTILAIDVQRGQATIRTLLARVVHVTERGPGAYAIGCEFASQLSEQELRELLR